MRRGRHLTVLVAVLMIRALMLVLFFRPFPVLMGMDVEDANQERRFEVSEAAREAGAVSSVSVVIESGKLPLGVLIAFTVAPFRGLPV